MSPSPEKPTHGEPPHTHQPQWAGVWGWERCRWWGGASHGDASLFLLCRADAHISRPLRQSSGSSSLLSSHVEDFHTCPELPREAEKQGLVPGRGSPEGTLPVSHWPSPGDWPMAFAALGC